ncbi:Protocadherin gamma-B3 [Saguinus oedipus]|uniref:Protocadherin gamma-B3 n=1 Tax=Saguinus oedipus TaxID=9490 RepID=A0ABQ9W5W1_SAGOE|nr:Protocadherin gamma-B3 [Saguinus oedipus]
MVPRTAQPGYLVTKASEPGLFSLGLPTGEVRTGCALGDREAARQRLQIAVRGGGQLPLSATVMLHLIFVDSLQEIQPDLSDRPTPSDPQAELQFYLVVALALISVLFLLTVILTIALRLCLSSKLATEGYFQPGLCSKTVPGVLPNYSKRTLPYSYNLYAASHSSNTEFKFHNIKAEDAAPQDLLCDEASWFESASNNNPKMASSSGNLQQLSFFKPFHP